MSAVFPGDVVPASHPNLKLGPGLLQVFAVDGDSSIIATKAGKLCVSSNKRNWWVDSNAKRYVPAAQESVVGTIVGRNGADGWRVDIGAAHQANLDALAFEGATKRNRPQLKVNALVYARVSLAHKDMEPELECFNADTHKADDFGELKGGFSVKVSLGFARLLLNQEFYLLPFLGSRVPIEIIVGVNGRIWFKSTDTRHIISIARALEAADPLGGGLSQHEMTSFIEQLDLS